MIGGKYFIAFDLLHELHKYVYTGWPKCTDFLFCDYNCTDCTDFYFVTLKLYGFLSWKYTVFSLIFTHFSKFFMKISKKNLVKMKLV